MAAASDQLTRLLTLIPWLVAHPGVTKADAARAFDVSPAQLERDLEIAACAEVGRDALASLDIDYWDDEITVLEARTVDRPLQLRVDEAVTLLVGLRSLAAVPGLADRSVVDQALAKVEEAIGSLAGTVTEIDRDEPVSSEISDEVQRGLTARRRLHLTYWTPGRDQVSERAVDPMRMVTVGRTGYLQGWCHLAESVRTFRLDRITAVRVLDQPATPPSVESLTEVAQPGSAWIGAPGDHRVVLDLAPDARWVVDYHPVDEAVELSNGGLRVTLRTPDLAWARRLVLRLGGRATVVSPRELAVEVVETARQALEPYG